MKTYLKIAIGTLFMGGLFASCTHDVDIDNSAEQDILKGYETVFKNAFGEPAPNQTWGFGETTVSSATRATSRAPQSATKPDWDFADAPTDDDFAYTNSNIPSDALLPSEYGDATKGSVHNYKLEETTNTQNVQFYAGNFNLYIEGTKSIYYVTPGDGSKNMKIYVMPNANVTFTQNFTQKGSGELTIYVPATATVNFAGGLQAYLTLYNRGTINIKGGYKPGIYEGGIFYNEGTFNIIGAQDYYFNGKNCSNPLTLNNGNSQFINAGTLNIGALTLEGSSHFLNLGTTNVSGITVVNSNDCTWVNEGQYTTTDYLYNAGSTDVRNNCKLTVTNMFTINLGDTDKNNFTNDAGASVVTENFEFQGPGYIKMGAKSLFKVNQTATMNITKPDYGFWGPTSGSDYAVLQAKDIVIPNTWNSKYVTYEGNLYVCAETHFAQQWSGQYPFYYLGDKAKIYASGNEFLDGVPNITIKASECNPGFNGGDDPDPSVVRIIAEDLTWGTENGDFDFNDVVFDVELLDNGNTIKITLQAAGGVLPIRIAGQFEVHDKFGVPTGTIVNTGTNLSISKPKVSWTFPNSDSRNYQLVNGQEVAQSYGSTVKEVAYNLPVEVQKLVKGSRSWVELLAPVGKAAAKVAVDNTYQWCEERQSIDDKYFDSSLGKGKFSMYVKKQSPYAEDGSWYK